MRLQGYRQESERFSEIDKDATIRAHCVLYADSLRNPNKKRYAIDYAAWRHGERDGFDTGNGPETTDAAKQLGYMAKQAVRMAIDSFFGE